MASSPSLPLHHCQPNALEHSSTLAYKFSVTRRDPCCPSTPTLPPRYQHWHSRHFLTGASLDFPVSFPTPSLKATSQIVLIILNYIYWSFFSDNIYSFKKSQMDSFLNINNVSYSLSEQKPNADTISKGTVSSQY